MMNYDLRVQMKYRTNAYLNLSLDAWSVHGFFT